MVVPRSRAGVAPTALEALRLDAAPGQGRRDPAGLPLDHLLAGHRRPGQEHIAGGRDRRCDESHRDRGADRVADHDHPLGIDAGMGCAATPAPLEGRRSRRRSRWTGSRLPTHRSRACRNAATRCRPPAARRQPPSRHRAASAWCSSHGRRAGATEQQGGRWRTGRGGQRDGAPQPSGIGPHVEGVLRRHHDRRPAISFVTFSLNENHRQKGYHSQ